MVTHGSDAPTRVNMVRQPPRAIFVLPLKRKVVFPFTISPNEIRVLRTPHFVRIRTHHYGRTRTRKARIKLQRASAANGHSCSHSRAHRMRVNRSAFERGDLR